MKIKLLENISGAKLPQPLAQAAAVVEEENLFHIIGGWNTKKTAMGDKIYTYDEARGRWVSVPTNLSVGRRLMTAISVKTSLFGYC